MHTIPSISPENPECLVKEASISDIDRLVEFARKTFYTTWKHVNTHEDLMFFLDSVFTREKVLPELDDSSVFTYLLICSGGKLAGYAKLRRDSIFSEMPSQRLMELEKFYFDIEFQGSGLASVLMREVIARAGSEKMDWLCLGVDINNHRAIGFYRKFGFEVFGKKSFAVGKQVDTDQLMRLRIS